jgi:N-acetylglutamate synthase-like GNAT family acetyltransferase
MSEEEPFLQRWSRRKLAARQGEPPYTDLSGAVTRPAAAETPAREAEPRAGPAAVDAEASTAAAFADVDFEALDFHSDYTRFLAPGVPEAVKNRALRKLWQSDPIFTAADPYQDYQGDYTDAALAIPAGTLRTAYRIGRGFLSDAEVAAMPAAGPGGRQQDPGRNEQQGSVPGQQEAVMKAQREGEGIAPATAGDFPAIRTLLGALGAPPDQCAALIADGVPVVIARRADTLVACGALLPGAEAAQRVACLAVARSARDAGIGTRLLAYLEAAAQKQGARAIQISATAPDARAFYGRRGYRPARSPDRSDRDGEALIKSLAEEVSLEASLREETP